MIFHANLTEKKYCARLVIVYKCPFRVRPSASIKMCFFSLSKHILLESMKMVLFMFSATK